MEELRVVARFAAESAQEVLPIFERVAPEDQRPRLAADAAWLFASGEPRTNLQREAAFNANRAAKSVADGAASHAAKSAGDAAAAAYLHPLAKATQVGHILRATAHAAVAIELSSDDSSLGAAMIDRAVNRAPSALIDVLIRYPTTSDGGNRVAHLMNQLDSALRVRSDFGGERQ